MCCVALACLWFCNVRSESAAGYARCDARPGGFAAICSSLDRLDCDGAFAGFCQWTSGDLNAQVNPPDFSQAGCKCFGTAGLVENQCQCNYASDYNGGQGFSGACSRWSKAACDAEVRMVRSHLNDNWAECGRGERQACENLTSKELCHRLGSRVVSKDLAASNATCVWVDPAECSSSYVFGCGDEESCSGAGGKWCATCTEAENTFSQFVPSLTFLSQCHPECHGDNAMCDKLAGCHWNWEGSPSHEKTYWCQRSFSIGGANAALSMLVLQSLVHAL